jgi:hypothetical protein
MKYLRSGQENRLGLTIKIISRNGNMKKRWLGSMASGKFLRVGAF